MEILNFFADHPGQSFTLSDLVRSLHLSRATAHAFLTTLAETDYLYRASDKSYVLGPAVGAIGRAAAEHLSPFQVAQPEMRKLADACDAVCTAVTREGNDVLLRERAASRSHLGLLRAHTGRLPLRPQFAGIFFAWSPASQADAWFDCMDPPAPADQREQMHTGMAFAREHGFLVSVRIGESAMQPGNGGGPYPEEIELLPSRIMTSLEAGRTYLLSSINAPVFGRDGKVAFAMGIASLTRPCLGSEILQMGNDLRTACERITGFLGGQFPVARLAAIADDHG